MLKMHTLFLFIVQIGLYTLPRLTLCSEMETPENTGQVCKQYSNSYGVAKYPDPNEVYQKRYYVEKFVDDRNAIITGVRYCNNAGGLLFKGFQMRYSTSSGDLIQEFGTMDDQDADADNCFNKDGSFASVSEDLVKIAVFADSNDVEGLLFGTETGSSLSYRANYPLYVPNPPAALGGRPIGFRIEFGHTATDAFTTPNQMMKVQVIYNACQCPVSMFLADAPPSDMTIEAAVGLPVTQELGYQQNRIGQIYGQDCGSYTIRLDSPLPGLLTLSSNGGVYTDRLELGAATEAQIGVYDVIMTIEQNQANGDGYSLPERGSISPISYGFRVTVNPCELHEVIAEPATVIDIEYTIADEGITFGPYSFTQSPACNYATTISATNPDFIDHDELGREFTINKLDDNSYAGIYDVKVQHKLQKKMSLANPFQTQEVVTDIQYRVRVHPCRITQVIAPLIDYVEYTIGETGFTFDSVFETDSLCDYSFAYVLSGEPSILTFNSDEQNFILSQSSDLTLRGQYNVALQATTQVSDGLIPATIDEYSATVTFVVLINPCPITNFALNSLISGPINYVLGDDGFIVDAYTLEQTNDCGYAETVQVTGLPSSGFIKHLASLKDFGIQTTTDQRNVGLYIVTIVASIQVPDTWIPSSKISTVQDEFTFEIRVNPCLVSSFDATQTIEDVDYILGAPMLTFGPYMFTQTPDCGYVQRITFEELPTAYVAHNAIQRDFSIQQTSDLDFVGIYNVVIRSTFDQPDYLGAKKPVDQTISFKLTARPCTVERFTVSEAIGPVKYTLGEAGFTFGTYEFVQSPDCGFKQEIIFSNLPQEPYFTHNSSDKTFTIAETSSIDFLGVYRIVIISEFLQPRIEGPPEKMGAQTEFWLTVHPCQVDQYKVVSAPFGPIFYILDNVDQTFGPYGFAQEPDCGYTETVTFNNLPAEPYLIHNANERTFTIIKTDDIEFLGEYDVTITSQFEQLNINKTKTLVEQTIRFQMIVHPCIVNTFQALNAEIGPILYTLDEPGFTFGTYEFIQSPYCGYAQTISFENMPPEPYFTHNASDRTFTITRTSAIEFLGEYEVVVQSSFQQLQIDKSTQEQIATTTFKLTVIPCMVTTFKAVSDPIQTVSYTLGEPSITIGPYEFAQSPDCGYLQTLTFDNLPAEPFVVHNEAAKTFTLVQTSDKTFIGEYNVVLTSQFQQLQFDGSTTQEQATIEFTIRAEACTVTDYTVVSDPLGPVFYTLDDPDVNIGPYAFAQKPNCGYPETIDVTGLPSPWVTHNQSDQTFKLIRTEDENFLGVYSVKITSTFQQLDINQKLQTVKAEIKFSITAGACTVSSFTAASDPIGPILYKLGDPSLTFGPYQFVQDPSCGYPEEISFVNLPWPFVVHDEDTRTFTIAQTQDKAFLGDYDVIIQSQFEQIDYDRVVTKMSAEITFTLNVRPCKVNSFDVISDPIGPINYTLGEPELTFGPYKFAQLPDCGYEQSVVLKNFPQVNYLSHDQENSQFTIYQTEASEFVGIYEAVIESEFQQTLNDGTSIPVKQQIEFTITISPCTVLTFDLISPPIQNTRYVLGDPQIKIGTYEFLQTPNCGYAQTVSIVNLPETFVQHDKIKREFIIDQTLDQDFLGIYQIVVKSQFEQPTVEKSITIVENQIAFTLSVDPCQTFFSSQNTNSNIQYTVGGEGFNFGFYSFVQTPHCGYTQTVTVQNMPPLPNDFIMHRPNNKDFNIKQTEDLSNVMTYIISVTSQISIPDNNSASPTYSVETADVQFTLEVINPCLTSVLDDFNVQDMSTSVQGVQAQQDLMPLIPKDNVSEKLGDQSGLTFCGERQFRILYTGHENYLQYDAAEHTLHLVSKDNQDVSQTMITIEAYLVLYQTVTKRASFQVTIRACEILRIQPIETANQAYQVSSEALVFSIEQFQMIPACGYPIDYQIEISSDKASYSPLPSWISQSDRKLTVEAISFDLIGVYTLRVKGSSEPGPVTAETYFSLKVASRECEAEELATDKVIDPISYLIKKQGEVSIQLAWQTGVLNFECPSEFTVTISQYGVQRELTSSDSKVISFDESSEKLKISTEDFSLDAQQWTINIVKTSLLSTSAHREAAYAISVAFEDVCWESTLIPPSFLVSSLTYDLFQEQSFLFNNMENTSEGTTFCGGFTYDLSYISGPLMGTRALDIYEISQVSLMLHEITARITNKDWLGVHTIVLRGTNGLLDESANARGNKGLFKTVESDPLTIEILNPCLTTVLNPDSALQFPELLDVPLGQTEIKQRLAGPKDSVSAVYGGGYSLCGPRQYVVTYEDGRPYTRGAFTLELKGNQPNGADVITIGLKSYEEGPSTTERLRIAVHLEQYPQIENISFLTTIIYRECFASKFEGIQIEDQKIQVWSSPFLLSLPFSQEPCQYEQLYQAYLYDEETESEKPLPWFMVLVPESLEKDQPAAIWFAITDSEDIGEYTVRVHSQLQNSVGDTATVDFKVTVFEVTDRDWSRKPTFDVNLETQFIAVGQSLVYSPEFVIEPNGWSIFLQVDLGRSGKFTKYDKQKRQFNFIGERVEMIDIGTHQVKIEARFSSSTQYALTFKRYLYITVYDGSNLPIPGPVTPAIGSRLPTWDGATEERLIPEIQVEDSDRPIPFIARLTETGLVTIGWDRKMSPPEGYEALPDMKVAIDDYSAFTVDEVQERLEFAWFREEGSDDAIRLALIDALEVRIRRADPDSDSGPIVFSWKVASYTQRFLQLQLDIKNPESIADDLGDPDILSVTFWGTNFFKSSEGKEVRFGAEVDIGVIRQINPREAEEIEGGLVYIKAYIIAIAISSIALFSFGSLVPLWIFVNSLQLLAHTTLLNTIMPGNVFMVLKEYLNLVRLNWPALNDALYDREAFRKFVDSEQSEQKITMHLRFLSDVTDSSENTSNVIYFIFLEASDYVQRFNQNLVIVTAIAIGILLVWATLAFQECMGARSTCKGRKIFKNLREPHCSNFALRFFYLFFLEFTLCMLISLAATEFTDFSAGFQWIISLVVFLLIVVYVGWLASLFLYNGPYLDGFYNTGTYLTSFWRARPFDTAFNAEQKLIKQEEKRARQKTRIASKEKTRRVRILRQQTKEVKSRRQVAPIKLDMLDGLATLQTERPMFDQDTGRADFAVGISNQSIDEMQKDQQFIYIDHGIDEIAQNSDEKIIPLVAQNDQLQAMMSTQVNIKSGMPRMAEIHLGQSNTELRPKDKRLFGGGRSFVSGADRSREEINFSQSSNSQQIAIVECVSEQKMDIPEKTNDDVSVERESWYLRDSTSGPSRATNQLEWTTDRGNRLPATSINFYDKVQRPESQMKELYDPARVRGLTIAEALDTIGEVMHQYQEENRGRIQQEIHPRDVLRKVTEEFDLAQMTPKEFSNKVSAELSKDEEDQTPGPDFDEAKWNSGASSAKTPGFASSHFGYSRKQSGPNQRQQEKYEGGEEESSSIQIQEEAEASDCRVSALKDSDTARALRASDSTFGGGLNVALSERALNEIVADNGSIKKKRRPRYAEPNYRYFQTQRVKLDRGGKLILGQKKEHEDIIYRSAKEMVAGSGLVKQSERFKTIHFGLRLNHPRNVALVHPLMFAIRRLVYALSIVFMARLPMCGVWLLMAGTLLMLLVAITEDIWVEPLNNHQHIFNESVTYLVCVVLLLFSGIVDARTRNNLGFLLIGLISIFLVYNGVLMLRKVTRLSMLLLTKWRKVRQQRNIKAEASEMSKRIQLALDFVCQPKKVECPHSSDDADSEDTPRVRWELPEQYLKVEMTSLETGGLRLEILPDAERLKLMQPLVDQEKEWKNRHKKHRWELNPIREASFEEQAPSSDSESSEKLSSQGEEEKDDKLSVDELQSVGPEKHNLNTEAGCLIAEDTQSPARRPLQLIENKPDGPSLKVSFQGVLKEYGSENCFGLSQDTKTNKERLVKLEFSKDEESLAISATTESLKDSKKNAESNENQALSKSMHDTQKSRRWFQPDILPDQKRFKINDNAENQESKGQSGQTPSSQEQFDSMITTPHRDTQPHITMGAALGAVSEPGSCKMQKAQTSLNTSRKVVSFSVNQSIYDQKEEKHDIVDVIIPTDEETGQIPMEDQVQETPHLSSEKDQVVEEKSCERDENADSTSKHKEQFENDLLAQAKAILKQEQTSAASQEQLMDGTRANPSLLELFKAGSRTEQKGQNKNSLIQIRDSTLQAIETSIQQRKSKASFLSNSQVKEPVAEGDFNEKNQSAANQSNLNLTILLSQTPDRSDEESDTVNEISNDQKVNSCTSGDVQEFLDQGSGISKDILSSVQERDFKEPQGCDADRTDANLEGVAKFASPPPRKAQLDNQIQAYASPNQDRNGLSGFIVKVNKDGFRKEDRRPTHQSANQRKLDFSMRAQTEGTLTRSLIQNYRNNVAPEVPKTLKKAETAAKLPSQQNFEHVMLKPYQPRSFVKNSLKRTASPHLSELDANINEFQKRVQETFISQQLVSSPNIRNYDSEERKFKQCLRVNGPATAMMPQIEEKDENSRRNSITRVHDRADIFDNSLLEGQTPLRARQGEPQAFKGLRTCSSQILQTPYKQTNQLNTLSPGRAIAMSTMERQFSQITPHKDVNQNMLLKETGSEDAEFFRIQMTAQQQHGFAGRNKSFATDQKTGRTEAVHRNQQSALEQHKIQRLPYMLDRFGSALSSNRHEGAGVVQYNSRAADYTSRVSADSRARNFQSPGSKLNHGPIGGVEGTLTGRRSVYDAYRRGLTLSPLAAAGNQRTTTAMVAGQQLKPRTTARALHGRFVMESSGKRDHKRDSIQETPEDQMYYL